MPFSRTNQGASDTTNGNIPGSGGHLGTSSCGLCKSIHDWMDSAREAAFSRASAVKKSIVNSVSYYEPFPVPPDADQLGRETWTFLHTLAAHYPDNPTPEHQKKARVFFNLLSDLYPCNVCSEHLKDELSVNPPRTSSNLEFSEWLCEVHNEVNGRLGKPTFDCRKVLERWKLDMSKIINSEGKA